MGVPAVEGEDNSDENAKKVVEERFVPTKFIALEITDEEIEKRLQTFPEEQIAGTHLNDKKIKILLKRYRTANDSSTGEFILEDFFRDNKIPCHHVTVSAQTESILESLVAPLTVDENLEKLKVKAKLEEEKLKKETGRKDMDKKEKIVRDIQHEDYVMKKENEQN